MGTIKSEVDSKGRRKAQCLLCKAFFHNVGEHVATTHGMAPHAYRAKFPDAPLLSEFLRGAEAEMQDAERAPVEEGVLRLGAAQLAVRSDVDENDSRLVPAFDEHFLPGAREMETWELLGLALQAREPSLLVGETGCGKSSGVLQLAAVMNQPVRRQNLHGDVRAADFVGEKVIDVDAESGQAVVMWRDGILPSAMRRGHWLLLDELDAAPPPILFVLQAVLEKGGCLVLPQNDGEVVAPHENFRVVATANTLGRGDDAGLYAGTNVLNEAFLDRFGVVIECDYPDAATEEKILRTRTGLSAPQARKLVEVAKLVRDGKKKEQCYCTFSTRRLIAWAAKSKAMGSVPLAARSTVLNRLSGDDRSFVKGIVERVVGTNLTRGAL